MPSPSTIGAGGEKRGKELFGRLWPVEQTHPKRECWDLINAPVPIEVKRQGVIKLGVWTRAMMRVHGSLWFYLLVPRNRTTKQPIPTDLVVMTWTQFEDLIIYQAHESPYKGTV